MAAALDGLVVWAAIGGGLAGALCGASNGYTEWLLADCADGVRERRSSDPSA